MNLRLTSATVTPVSRRSPANLARCCFCLLVLDADQRCLVLLIKKPDFQQGIRQQRNANHRDEQRDVLREQAATHFEKREVRRCEEPWRPEAARRCGPE